MPTVSFIGVDGLSLNVLRMLYKSGVCIDAGRILYSYRFFNAGTLNPPLSCGCWVSIATGLNPGYTGVLDCACMVYGRARLFDSSVYRRVSLWDRASRMGFKAAVLEYPLLTPAYELEGGAIVSTWGLERTSYPRSILESIDEELGRTYMRVNLRHPWRSPEECVEDAISTLEDKIRASKHLRGSGDWDLYVEVIVESDWVLHRTLHCIDDRHPRHSECSGGLRRVLESFWSMLLNHLIEVAGDSRVSVIASDHGFKPLHRVYDLREQFSRVGFTSGFKTTAPPGIPYPGIPLYTSCSAEFIANRLSGGYRVYSPRRIYEGPLSSLLPNIVVEPVDRYSAASWGSPGSHGYTGVHSRESTIGVRGFRVDGVKTIFDYKRIVLEALRRASSKTRL